MAIVSHPANENYRNNFDATFGKKAKQRRTFTVPEADVQALSKWTTMPYMVVAGKSPSDHIQAIWERLAKELSFDIDTVEDINAAAGTFTAVEA